MSTRCLSLTAIAGLVLSACSASVAPTTVAPATGIGLGTPAASGNEPSVTPQMAPTIFTTIAASLTFTTEDDAAAQAEMTFNDGGTVHATAGDGTTFELIVPPNAVVEDTTITMTPLADVQGVGDGPVHAVRLEPEGLQFVDWPRLTITPSSPIPAANQVRFNATGAGDEVMAALVDPASEPIVILLPHFSTVGVGYAEGQGVWLAERALLPLKQLAHQVGRHLQNQQFRYSQGEDADASDLAPYFDAAQQALRAQQMTDATLMSCEATRIYMKALLDLERQRQYIGLSTDETEGATAAEVRRAYDASYTLCERLKIQECQAKRNPAILVGFWIAWDRYLQLAFADETPFAITDDMQERAKQLCRGGDQFEFSGEARVRVPGGTVPISWHYWGIRCAKSETWQVWEVFDGINQNVNVPPGQDAQPPILITFDENGMIATSTWAPLGSVPGTLQGTALQLSPNSTNPTRVVASINEGSAGISDQASVEPFDASFGDCPAID